MISDSTKVNRSGRTLRATVLMLTFTSGNRGIAVQNILCISLLPFSLILAGSLHAAEVRHACDARVFQPCPSFLAKVEVKKHTTLSESKSFGYTRSEGAWTVHVDYQPVEECAKVSLFVNIGPLEFDRIYKRTFVNGGGTIDDSGVFMYKIGQLDTALRVASASCFMPKRQSDLSRNPDPAQDTFDRELRRQGDQLGVYDEPKSDLDQTLERLARQEEQRSGRREDLSIPGETEVKTYVEDPSETLERFERKIQKILEERQEQERIAEIERQQENNRGLQTFFQMLGTGMQLYQLLEQDSSSSMPTSSGFSSFTPLSSGNHTHSGASFGRCTTAQGRPGFIDGQGRCRYDDTARAR